jgi:hypothetical protein
MPYLDYANCLCLRIVGKFQFRVKTNFYIPKPVWVANFAVEQPLHVVAFA